MLYDALWRDVHRMDVWELLAFSTRWHSPSEAKTSRKLSMRESGMAARDRARQVDMVHLVSLLSLVQPNKPDRPNRPNEQDRLVDFFSILLEQIADQPDRLFRRGSGMDEMRREIFEQAHPGLVGTQQNHGLLCLQRQRNF